MHFGFSCVGLIVPMMPYLPNLIRAKHRSKDCERYAVGENKVLLTAEQRTEPDGIDEFGSPRKLCSGDPFNTV